MTCERFAHDTRRPGRCGFVGSARSYDDCRETKRSAVDEAFSTIIVDKILADHLGDTVGRLGVWRNRIVDDIGHFAAECGTGTGVDDTRCMVQGAAAL